MRINRLLLFLAFLPWFGLAQSTGQTASLAEEQDYAFAYGLFSDSLYQIAMEEFDRFVVKYPSSLKRIDASYLAIECRFQLQHFDTAARLFERFVQDYPSTRLTDDAYLRLGEAYLRLNQHEKAVSSFKAILDRFGQSDLAGEAAYWIGESFVRTSEFENAIKYYTLAYEHYPKNRLRDYSLYGIGWTYQTKQDYAKALDAYQRFRREFPESPLHSASLVRTGECFYYMKDYRRAIQELATSKPTITREEERGEAEYLIAEAYFNLGEFERARQQYESFLSEFPRHRLSRDVTYALGWTYLKMNNFARAEEVFDRLTAGDDPLAHSGLFRRGMAERFGGKNKKAIETWGEVVRRVPTGEFSDNALYETGLVLYEENRYTEARSSFTRVKTEFPESDVLADALRMAGECFLAESKVAEAKPEFAAAAASPGASFETRTSALFQLGWCQVKLREFVAGIETMTRFLQGYEQHPKAAEARFWRAEARYQLGEFQGSFEDYESVAQKAASAKREQSLYGAGWSLYKLGEYEKAIVRFEQLIREYPASTLLFDARLRLGDCYFFAKEYVKAEGAYRAVIRQFRGREGLDYAQYQLGQTYYRSGNFNDAVAQFRLLISDFPSSALADDAQYAIGWIWFQNKDYPEAIREFQKLLDQFPTSELAARAIYSIGDGWYNQQNYVAAEQSYRQVLRRYPQSQYVGDALTGIQYCLLAQGKRTEAMRVIDDFVRENPKSPLVETLLLKKGDLLFSQQQYDDAIREYQAFVKEYPQSSSAATAHYWIGRSYAALERFLDAASSYERAAKVRNASPSIVAQASMEAADVYARLKSYERGLSALSLADWLDPNQALVPEVIVRRGMLQEDVGDLASALQSYNTVISSYGRTAAADKARIAMARIYLRETNYTEAERLAAGVATGRSDVLGAEAQYLLGSIFASQKDWQKAATAFLRVRYVFPSHEEWLAKAYLGLGSAYEQLKEIPKAREAYRNVLKLERQQDSVAEARRRLNSLERS